MTKIKSDVIRVPITHIPKDVATRILAEPRNKLSNKSRKRFLLARASRVDVETGEPKPIQEKYCAKLRKLTLASLGQQLVQAGKQLNNLDRILFLIDHHHKDYNTLMQQRTLQLYRQGWIEEELNRRCSAKPVAPKSVPVTDETEPAFLEKGDFDPKGYQNPDGN